MANIKDIAKQCKVNPATVSRALNGKKGVSEKVRARIIKTAQRLGYSKNPLAAGLITHKSGIIGLVVPDITNPYYASVAQGVSAVLRQSGYGTFLCDSTRSRDQEQQYFGMLCSYRVEGVVLLSVTAKPADLEIFKEKGIRVICVDNPISNEVSTVLNDNYQGACDLTEHLVRDCNVRRLVAIMGTRDAETTHQRLRGCTETLSRLGVPEVLAGTVYTQPDYDHGDAIMDEVMKLSPDCVFAINDQVALGAFSWCLRNHVDVPRQLKLCGFDDIAAASMISVPLTTVHQRKYVLGEKAASQLIYELKNPDSLPMRIELLPKLVVRASCGELMNAESAQS